MQLKIRQSPSALRFGSIRLYARWLIGIFAAVALLAAAFLFGARLEQAGKMAKVHQLLELNKARVVTNYISSFGASPEHITIDIKHKHYLMLAGWRTLAMQRNQITTDLKNYVPAVIRYKDQELRAKVRLKGDWTDHVETDKWSFRVRLKGDHTLFGMKCFSLQHPQTRSYLNEWFYQRAMAREDVAALRYEFVDVTVNGRDRGLYALEEHFMKQLIENNQRREGVILRFDSELLFDPFDETHGIRGVSAELNSSIQSGIGSQHASHIVAYDEEKLDADPVLQDQLHAGFTLLESFRDGKLPTHKVFDTERLAKFFAIAELTGAIWTADDWSDRRFLYNPVTSRLEPIAVEGTDYQQIGSLLGIKYTNGEVAEEDFHARIFSDPVFFKDYIAALTKVSDEHYLNQLLTELEPELKRQKKIVHREFPYKDLATDVFRSNAKTIRYLLNPEKGLHAYLTRQDAEVCQVELAAIQPLPVEVVSLSAGSTPQVPKQDVILPGMRAFKRPHFETISFSMPANESDLETGSGDLQLHYRLLGSNLVRTAAVFPRPRTDVTIVDGLPRRNANIGEFPFLSIDETNKTVEIEAGHWHLKQQLVVPAGYQLVAGPGVQLSLEASANILSYSPLRFNGSQESPIVIDSPSGDGQGVVVLNAARASVLRHVVFRDLATPQQSGWELTGAVTFYRSPVEFHDCEFSRNRSEDGLNVIRSQFLIHNTFFSHTPSDALDVDFSDGSIRQSSFSDVGGDAVDVSGGSVSVRDLRMQNVSDKGISVGERSVMTGRDIAVQQSRIGIAAKDSSTVRLTDVALENLEIGLAVFQKKPEYGPAALEITRITLSRVTSDYIVEKSSRLRVNGEDLPDSDRNVKQMIYATEDRLSSL